MFRFTNNYPSTVWVMLEWHHANCPDGGDWEKKGWWQIEPGQSAVAFGGDVNDLNSSWYWFAHAQDGAVWAGPFQEIVPDHAFDWCTNTADTSSRTIGMREVDVGDVDNYTVNLTPG